MNIFLLINFIYFPSLREIPWKKILKIAISKTPYVCVRKLTLVRICRYYTFNTISTFSALWYVTPQQMHLRSWRHLISHMINTHQFPISTLYVSPVLKTGETYNVLIHADRLGLKHQNHWLQWTILAFCWINSVDSQCPTGRNIFLGRVTHIYVNNLGHHRFR